MFLSPDEKSTDALFSCKGLIQIIDTLNLSNLKLPVYVNIHNTKTQQTEYYRLNDYNNSRKRDLLMASSALPIAYEKVKINNTPYQDGGVLQSGNVSVKPLYQNGYRDIIIASLNHNVKYPLSKANRLPASQTS